METRTELSALSSKMRTSLRSLSTSGVSSVLPDYFVDRFVAVESIEDLISKIRAKSSEGGGGSLRGISQSEVKGGNAVNLAYALGKFGANVHLLAIADSLPADALRSTFCSMSNVNLEIVPGKNGYTIALEFLDHGRHVNVMVSDTGELAEFDGSKISRESWDTMSRSKIVAVVNWAANKKGNELCEKTFTFAKRHGARTFFDPADVAELSRNLPAFKNMILDKGLLDVMSMNDNELRIICKILCNYSLPQEYSEEDLRMAVKLISDQSGAIVDIHTRNMSMTAKDKVTEVAYCHKVRQKIVTGAGDVWDAADIVGHILPWEPQMRLRFANAAAGLYVSGEIAEPPTVEDVLKFFEGNSDYY